MSEENQGPPCPWCGKPAEATHVDNGVGMQRVEPWGCERCQARQLDYHEEMSGEISALVDAGKLEIRDGWIR